MKRQPPWLGGLAWIPLALAGSGVGDALAARTWRITPEGTGDAPTIQAGIDSAVAGDEVLLAPGSYTWSQQAASGASMLLIEAGITLRGEAGAAQTLLDAQRLGRILTCSNAGDQVRIEDLTFLNGLAPPENEPAVAVIQGSDDSHGGAIDVLGATTPTIRRCVFRGNQAQGGAARGGAVACERASFEDCHFEDNEAGVSGPTNGRGGAVWSGAATFRRCVFRSNRAWGFDAGSGGAVRSRSALFEHCTFEANTLECPGGPRGGAIFDPGNPVIADCTFRDNVVTAHYFYGSGGAVDVGSGTITDCLFVDNVALCFTAAARGGALSGDDLLVERCVFLGNAAFRSEPLGPGQGGAIFARFESIIRSCTLVGNSGGTAEGVGGIAFVEGGAVQSSLVAHTAAGSVCSGNARWSCSNVFANAGGNQVCGIREGIQLALDPFFCDADPLASENVSIRADSPCVDPGGCGLVGAEGVACEATAVLGRTWGDVKRLYR